MGDDSGRGLIFAAGILLGGLAMIVLFVGFDDPDFAEARARSYINDRREDLGMVPIPETECPFCYLEEPAPLDDEPWVTGHHPMPKDGAVR